jgi:small subunit ribosomal protein S3
LSVTTYGIIGIKVWVFKGEVFTDKTEQPVVNTPELEKPAKIAAEPAEKVAAEPEKKVRKATAKVAVEPEKKVRKSVAKVVTEPEKKVKKSGAKNAAAS